MIGSAGTNPNLASNENKNGEPRYHTEYTIKTVSGRKVEIVVDTGKPTRKIWTVTYMGSDGRKTMSAAVNEIVEYGDGTVKVTFIKAENVPKGQESEVIEVSKIIDLE